MSAPQVVLVTGGARGIGAGIATRLARDGHAVGVGYAHNQRAANDTVARIRNNGGTAVPICVDVTDSAAVPAAVQQVAAELGPLTVLVNNAAVLGTPGALAEMSDDELTKLVATNIVGVFVTSREAVRAMSPTAGGHGGVIVNIGSVAARTGGLPGLAAYAATKGAVVTFTRGLAAEVGHLDIRVVSVSPGIVATDMITPDIAEVGRGAPLGRLGRPDDIAGAVAWLISDDASFVSGTDITVAGGR